MNNNNQNKISKKRKGSGGKNKRKRKRRKEKEESDEDERARRLATPSKTPLRQVNGRWLRDKLKNSSVLQGYLEGEHRNKYGQPLITVREELALATGNSLQQVSTWFQSRVHKAERVSNIYHANPDNIPSRKLLERYTTKGILPAALGLGAPPGQEQVRVEEVAWSVSSIEEEDSEGDFLDLTHGSAGNPIEL